MDSSLGSRSTTSESGCLGGCLSGDNKSSIPHSSNTEKKALSTDDDALLAKELNKLSFEEREKVFSDIHGVTDRMEETPEFIESLIKKLDKELAELPRARRSAFERAVFLKPSIETDVQFKLMFLRGDDYDAFKAARRLAKYFEHKADLFGETKLARKITMTDLSPEEMQVLKSGPFLRVTNVKDAAGRPIWLSNIPEWDFSKGTSLLRCAWYMMTTGLEDEATQTRGVCNVIYCPSGRRLSVPISQFWNVMVKGGEMLANLPVRTTCSHFCYDSASMEFVLAAYRKVLGQEKSLRLRAHFGSGLEIQYKLMTFGIKFPYLLESKNGHDEKVEAFQGFIQERMRQEEEAKRQQEAYYRETLTFKNRNNKQGFGLLIPYPELNDVLVGRGRPYQSYCGNVMLSKVIENHFLGRYIQAPGRFDKSFIHMDVVKAIQEVCGGRFVERTTLGWKVVDDKIARKKVNSSFRSKMSKLPLSVKNNKNNNATKNIGIGQKLKQPFSTLDVSNKNCHPNGSDNGTMPWGVGDGIAKQARHDSSGTMYGNGNGHRTI